MIKPIILCGGKGSRLWPMSRELFPKQFLAMQGEHTLLQQTALRLNAVVGALPPLLICNETHRFMVAEQMQAVNQKADILLEPMGRDTAPAVAVAALLHEKEDPLLFVMPSDHAIANEKALATAVAQAAELAEAGNLVTFGIRPNAPETGYGYLHAGKAQSYGFSVERFVEKPNAVKAAEYLASGDYYWNSGMFLFKASVYLQELAKFAPEMLDACRKAVQNSCRDLDFIRLAKESFSACPANSVDYAVMEKTAHCAMISLDVGWSDLGSWTSLYELGTKDEHGNVCVGDVLCHESKNCYLRSEKHLMAAIGLDDIVAVESADALLISHKNCTQNVKAIVTKLREEGRPEALTHNTVYRPWGSFECLAMAERFQVKRIIVKPHQVLSLQMHHHRAEHWTIVSGTALVTVGEKEVLLHEDQSTYIPVGEKHRLENPGCIPLVLIEIQTGAYLGEDDIVRFEDRYGRTQK